MKKFTISLPHSNTFPDAAQIAQLIVELDSRGFDVEAYSSNAYRTIVVVDSREVIFGSAVVDRLKEAVVLAGGQHYRFDVYHDQPLLPLLWD